LVSGLLELRTVLAPPEVTLAGRTISLGRNVSLHSIVNPLSHAFIILAFAVMVELAMRITGRAGALRALRSGQPSGTTGPLRLMDPPSGVIFGAGLVFVAVFALDYALYFVIPQQSEISVGWGPALEVSRVVSMVDKGLLLIVLGVMIAYLARISLRLQALEDGAEAAP
jgi:hypothetical protein